MSEELGLNHTKSRAEPNRTEPVQWLMFVSTHQPKTGAVAQQAQLPGVEVRVFLNKECKHIGLRSFNQCGAFKVGFLGTK